jgi:pantoate--beta-alanine ligase
MIMPVKSTTHPLFLESFDELSRWRQDQAATGPGKAAVGFVPTMGALHEGHLSLVHQSVKECRKTVVSIFVNPLQFGANEDLDRYPRPLDRDMAMCAEAGVDAIFHPLAREMYPHGQDLITKVVPPETLTERLCGLFRPGHFSGVATVVAKLFSLVQPQRAYFGEKDYQQLTVIHHMVRDLNLPLEVVNGATIRERDGLAMSSRNVYLTPEQRALAPVLYEVLTNIANEVRNGTKSISQSIEAGRSRLSSLPGVSLQYLEACDVDSLQPLERFTNSMVVLVAAKFGDVRLIDNVIVRA